MKRNSAKIVKAALSLTLLLGLPGVTLAGQAPGPLRAPDVPVSHRDRIYAAEQFSNTVSVTDPVNSRTTIRASSDGSGAMSTVTT